MWHYVDMIFFQTHFMAQINRLYQELCSHTAKGESVLNHHDLCWARLVTNLGANPNAVMVPKSNNKCDTDIALKREAAVPLGTNCRSTRNDQLLVLNTDTDSHTDFFLRTK